MVQITRNCKIAGEFVCYLITICGLCQGVRIMSEMMNKIDFSTKILLKVSFYVSIKHLYKGSGNRKK